MCSECGQFPIFVTKKWVAVNLGIAEAEQERKRFAGTFPQLVVLGDNANDPQARVAYYYSEIVEWARTRPRRPIRLRPCDDSQDDAAA